MRCLLPAILLACSAFALPAAAPASPSNVTFGFPDSVTACPGGDSVVAGRPARLRVELTYTQFPGGMPAPRVGAPPESVWVEWTIPGAGVFVNDQPGRAFADDSTDALGRTRVTLPSLSGCGSLEFTLWVAGEPAGGGTATIRSADADGDGAVTLSDAPCDLDYDGAMGAADFGAREAHLHHSHRNALFGTLVRRTNLCETCGEDEPGTLGESSVSWSPDGRRLAFTIHLPPDGACAAFLLPSDPGEGDVPIQFTFPDSLHDYDPTWSPLGTEIAFGRADNTIWVKGIPGLAADTSLRLVTRHLDGSAQERGDVTPSFSPDGEWIAFSRKTAVLTHWEIWKTPANGDTTRRVQLTFETNGDDFYPQWSTDGQWILYARIVGGAHSTWKLPAAGGSPVPVLLSGSGLQASTPAFSPDGAVILAGVGSTLGAETHTLDATLSGITMPTDSLVGSYPGFDVEGAFPVLSPRLSPDGTRLALRTHQLWAARRNMNLPPRVRTLAGVNVTPQTPFVDLAGHAGSPTSFQVVADDPESDPVTLDAFFLRDGMSFDPEGGMFSWTPPESLAGTVAAVRFQATTPSGGSSYAIARIAVGDVSGVDDLPVGLTIERARPNPFDERAILGFTIPRPEEVSAEVFDMTGRRVYAFPRRTCEPGRNELSWNGRNHAGRSVAPGVYVFRLRAGGATAERKLVREGGAAGGR